MTGFRPRRPHEYYLNGHFGFTLFLFVYRILPIMAIDGIRKAAGSGVTLPFSVWSSLLAISLALWGGLDAKAAPVTADQAMKAVSNWVQRKNSRPMEMPVGSAVASARTHVDDRMGPLFHVVRLAEGGFVVTAADDRVHPVIAFSGGSDLDESPGNPLFALLKEDIPRRLSAAAIGRMKVLPAGSARSPEAEWASLLDETAWPMKSALESVDDIRVPALVASRWGQSTVAGLNTYNYYTPNNSVCGCVATAGAQLMRYHQYPIGSVASVTNICVVDGVNSNLAMRGGTYNWASMPPVPTAAITLAQRQSIGKLTYDVGVSVYMDYSAADSAAFTVMLAPAYTGTFHYASAIGLQDLSGLDAQIPNAILSNLDAGFPVVLGVRREGDDGGHAVVGDGYGYSGGLLYVHINMGWSGGQDAWYNLPDIDSIPAYDIFHRLVFNVFPTQTIEIISGRVLDTGGNPVAGAHVTAENTATGIDLPFVTTNPRGIYAVKVPRPPDGNPVNYALSARYNDSSAFVVTNITASRSRPWTYDPLTGSLVMGAGSGNVGNRWGVDLALTPVVLTINPTNRQHTAAAAIKQSVSVTANVAWTAAASEEWITITSGASGTTNGTVMYRVTENPGGPRQGFINVTDGYNFRLFTVEQAPAAVLLISPTNRVHTSTATTGQLISVIANTNWTGVSDRAWLVVTAGHAGATNGVVTYRIDKNAGSARQGAIRVSGAGITNVFSVYQEPPPALTISPASRVHGSAAINGQTVAVTANILWMATPNQAWITVTAGGSGNTNGTVTYGIARNASAARSGSITVTGGGLTRVFAITQGAAPVLAISPTNRTYGSDAISDQMIAVTANVSWTATSGQGWLTVIAGSSGSTNANITYGLSRNISAARSGTITVTGGGLTNICHIEQAAYRHPVQNDFDGDGRSDRGYYNPVQGRWMLNLSGGGVRTNLFGYAGTVPFTGDFDGDGITDYGCYDPNGIPGHASPGSWYIMQSRRGFRTATFGYPGTIPIVGDFDGDGQADFGCYDPDGIPGHVSPGSWYIMQSRRGFRTATFGYPGTIPIVGDFDGDGQTDFGCYDPNGIPGYASPGSWYIMQSRRGFRTATFGYPGTIPIVGDFDGDGQADFGCYDPDGIPGHVSPGSWYIMQSGGRFRTETFGYRGTVPIIGDYDGDGRADFGCYDPNGIPGHADPGAWYIMQSGGRFLKTTFGGPGTVPLGK